jgi:hypothetical protein
MQALYDFIVEPVGERYNNKIKLGDKELILNTKIETFQAVNKLAKVISIPKNIKTNIQVDDIIVIHHNVFRRFYDIKGKEKNSRSYFKDNKYFVSLDQIYLYYNGEDWNSVADRCFIKPGSSHRSGIVIYDNKHLNTLGIYKGKLISFKEKRQFEFIINNELLYCMKSKDVLIDHGYEENKKENNRSRTESS